MATIDFTKLEKPLYAYATKAYHILGEISRGVRHDNYDSMNEFDRIMADAEAKADMLTDRICQVYGETETDWIGAWITGLGFFDVRFPKATTRPLTEAEIKEFAEAKFRISNGPSYKYSDVSTIPAGA